MVKEFIFKGKTLQELQELSLTELAKLLPSRERRTLMRGLDDDKKYLIEKIGKKDSVKTHIREMIVLPQFVGKTIRIYGGKEYKAVLIEPEMIGLRFGELSLTRSNVKHSSPGVGATKSSAHVSVK